MLLQPMRYKDYVWRHNPRTYTITYRRRMAVQEVPYGYDILENLGQTHRVMRGSGEFAGKDAYSDFSRLATVFYTGGKGVLIHPCWQSADVYFVDLSLTQEPRPDYVAYTFEFWESYDKYDTTLRSVAIQTAAAAAAGTAYHVVKKGETLWAIARKYGVDLSALLSYNTGIKNPNLIYVGQKVRVK